MFCVFLFLLFFYCFIFVNDQYKHVETTRLSFQKQNTRFTKMSNKHDFDGKPNELSSPGRTAGSRLFPLFCSFLISLFLFLFC